MSYYVLLFDLDNTIFDAGACDPAAFAYALEQCGVPDPDRYWGTYAEINDALWAAVVRQELTPNEVQDRRFAELAAAAQLDADPDALAAEFVVGMGIKGGLYPGAREILSGLAEKATLALVTNGLGEVVRARVDRLDLESLFSAIVISGEAGVSKPSAEIFDLVFEDLGAPPKEAALMIGDSLSSDIAGATNYGIATCWYNPAGKPAPDGVSIDHVIGTLDELPALVTGNA